MDGGTGRFRHHDASMDPEIFIHGPKIAGAKAASALLRTPIASPDAMPPFCIPTSMAIVRHVISSMRISRDSQYPKK